MQEDSVASELHCVSGVEMTAAQGVRPSTAAQQEECAYSHRCHLCPNLNKFCFILLKSIQIVITSSMFLRNYFLLSTEIHTYEI